MSPVLSVYKTIFSESVEGASAQTSEIATPVESKDILMNKDLQIDWASSGSPRTH